MTEAIKSGIPSALDAMRPQDELPGEQWEQPDLLGMPVKPLVSGVPTSGARGRPPGARNKRTAEWASYLGARYGSPLEMLMQLALAPVDDLARQLRCDPLDALQEKRHAAVALLPYLHTRMPIAVDVTNHKVVTLTIVDQVPEGSGDSIASDIIGVVTYQPLSEDEDGAV